MTNRIRGVRLANHRLNPAEAEVWLAVHAEQPADILEIRGRLMGPRCPYASTVEIAYPLRPLPPGGAAEGFQVRALIPEPSLWEPQSPFLYFGPVELWQDGSRVDQVQVSHGLRVLQLTPQGLRVNGRPLALHGVRRATLTEDEARALHDRAVNLVLADVRAETAGLWDIADRFGLLMLGRLHSAADLALALRLRGHASVLGWLLCCELLGQPWLALAELRAAGLIGAELEAPAEALPEEVAFVVQSAPLAGPQAWPALVVGHAAPANGAAAARLGHVEP
jgi:hypothetical protein